MLRDNVFAFIDSSYKKIMCDLQLDMDFGIIFYFLGLSPHDLSWLP